MTAVLAILASIVAALRSSVIVDQTEAVYVTEFGRPVRLIDEPGLHLKLAASEPPRLRQAAPARRAAAARDADEGQEEPGSRLVRELEDRRRRPVPPSVRTMPDASARLEDMAASVLAAELGGHDLAEPGQGRRAVRLAALMNDVTGRIGEQAAQEYGLRSWTSGCGG